MRPWGKIYTAPETHYENVEHMNMSTPSSQAPMAALKRAVLILELRDFFVYPRS